MKTSRQITTSQPLSRLHTVRNILLSRVSVFTTEPFVCAGKFEAEAGWFDIAFRDLRSVTPPLLGTFVLSNSWDFCYLLSLRLDFDQEVRVFFKTFEDQSTAFDVN